MQLKPPEDFVEGKGRGPTSPALAGEMGGAVVGITTPLIPALCSTFSGKSGRKRRPLHQLHQHFAEITAVQQVDEGLGRAFQALAHRFAVAQATGGDLAGEFA